MQSTAQPEHPLIDWGNCLDLLIENIPFPASVKSADTGRYIKANAQAAQSAGLTQDRFIGLHLQDLTDRVKLPSLFVEQIAQTDHQVIQNRKVYTFQQTFLDYAQAIQVQRVVKLPTIADTPNAPVTGIFSYSQDIKKSINLNQLFDIYQHYFQLPLAIARFLHELRVSQFFHQALTHIEMTVLLSMRKHSHSSYIANDLQSHPRTIDKHKDTLRDKLHTLDLEEVVSLIRTRHEKKN